jgi:hypothetical protein
VGCEKGTNVIGPDGRRQRDQRLSPWLSASHSACGIEHDRKQPDDLLSPASRKQPDHQLIRGHAQSGSRPVSRECGEAVEQRVTHELHRHPPLPVEICLKLKAGQHLGEDSTDRSDPPRARGPELRGHKIDRGDTVTVSHSGQANIEFGKIHEHNGAGSIFDDPSRADAKRSEQNGKTSHRLRAADNGEACDVMKEAHTSFSHLSASHSRKLPRRGETSQNMGEG